MSSAVARLPAPTDPGEPERQPDDAALLIGLCGARPAAVAALLERVGGLRGLLADPAAVHGDGLSAPQAHRLASGLELALRLARQPAEAGWRVRSPLDVGQRLQPEMGILEREELRVLLLNSKNVVSAVRTVYVGNLAGAPVRVGEVFRDAVRRQAAAIVVVHNHPSVDPAPSADDLRITAELAEAGRLLDIELLDHVVVAADGWVSLRQSASTW